MLSDLQIAKGKSLWIFFSSFFSTFTVISTHTVSRILSGEQYRMVSFLHHLENHVWLDSYSIGIYFTYAKKLCRVFLNNKTFRKVMWFFWDYSKLASPMKKQILNSNISFSFFFFCFISINFCLLLLFFLLPGVSNIGSGTATEMTYKYEKKPLLALNHKLPHSIPGLWSFFLYPAVFLWMYSFLEQLITMPDSHLKCKSFQTK